MLRLVTLNKVQIQCEMWGRGASILKVLRNLTSYIQWRVTQL